MDSGTEASALPSVDTIRQRAIEVSQRVEAAGGSGETVSLVAVTKAFPVELARRAVAAGLVDLGENYAQELVAKVEELGADVSEDGAGSASPRWHFIGGLQRNKVKLLAGSVRLWHTVDREALVDEIAKRSPGDRVLIQVNTTAEPQKSGCVPEAAAGLVGRARERGLIVEGLMTVGPTETDVDPRPGFVMLRQAAERCEVRELSMGMSADYELAVAEGATLIRVGSVLFGPRPAKQ